MAQVVKEEGRDVVLLEPEELEVHAQDWNAVLSEFARTSIELGRTREQVEYFAGQLDRRERECAELRAENRELRGNLINQTFEVSAFKQLFFGVFGLRLAFDPPRLCWTAPGEDFLGPELLIEKLQGMLKR